MWCYNVIFSWYKYAKFSINASRFAALLKSLLRTFSQINQKTVNLGSHVGNYSFYMLCSAFYQRQCSNWCRQIFNENTIVPKFYFIYMWLQIEWQIIKVPLIVQSTSCQSHKSPIQHNDIEDIWNSYIYFTLCKIIAISF